MSTSKPEVTLGTFLTKRVEEELHESEVRFQTMFEHAAIGMSIKTLNGCVLDANPALCRMFGKSLEEVRGRQFVEMTHPEDVQQSIKDYAEILSGKIDSYETERRYLRSNGEAFWGRTSNSLVRNSEGTPLFIIHMLEDIDRRKRIREELRESEARFRAMFDNASVGMALMSLDRRVIKVNQAAQRILGYTAEELLVIEVSKLAHPEDQEIGSSQFAEMIAGSCASFQMERRYMHKNGKTIWARVTYSVVPDEHGKPQYLVGLIEDINEERLAKDMLAEQERRYRTDLEFRVEERTRALAETNLRLLAEIAQRRRAEEALRAKAAEEAVIAERTRLARDLHDAVTQTLFSASLIAEVLPELWKSDLEEAQKSTEELRQLTRGALAEMRTLLLELRPSALTQSRFEDLLKQLCEALIGRTRLPINLRIEGEGRLQPEVQVALYRIAQESLNNAAKYARASHVYVHLRISDTSAAMEIRDDGAGFDIKQIKPSSLGVRIMRERAEAIGAELMINSTISQGTQISVSWKQPSIL
jgi:PAS domain S-box-containing protein